MRRFRAAGAELALPADFPALRDTPPEVFVREILVRDCHCVAAACGENHRFGRMGAGTPELLRALLGENVLVCPAVLSGGEPISSTRIRRLLTEGRPDAAAERCTAAKCAGILPCVSKLSTVLKSAASSGV